MGVKTSIPKVDGMGLLLGKPAYTDDLAPRDALIVKVLRSPHAHARIVDIDTRAAQAIPEIKCIFTYENVPQNVFSRAGQGFPEPSPYDARILDRTLRYVGDAVAIVAGTTEKIVDLALSKIKVTYEVLPAVNDFEKALDHAVLVHASDGTSSQFPIGHDPARNLAAGYAMEIGDVKAVMSTCEVVHHASYYTQAQAHAMTEPHASVAYLDYQDRLTVITSTQTPFHVRRILARNLGMPISAIRVIKPRIGGGYGGKQAIHGEFYVALVTRTTGLPAKLVYSRKEVFTATYTRHQMRIDIAMGAMKDGSLKAIDVNVLSNTGAYGEHALTVLMVVGSKTLPLYNKVDAVGFRGDVVYTNQTPAGAFRGYGAIQGNFALESMMDEMAEKLGLDPIAFRQKNMIAEGETSKIFEVMGEGTEGTAMTIESCKLEACLKNVLNMSDWWNKFPRQVVDADRVRGVGLALAMQGSGIPFIDMASAILKLNDDGFFNLLIGATDLGTGSDTILAQIAAETLGVPDSKIIVYSSDTDLTPYDTGAFASSTTYVSGHSVRIAAERMKAAIIDKGKRFFGTETADFDGEQVTAGENSLSLADFSTKLFYSEHQEQLVAHGSYVGTKSPPPYMVGACEVEVDKRTGKVQVTDYYASVDCGTPINPNLVRIQVEGALLQGIGMTLYEEVNRRDDGHLLNDSFLSYKVPTRMDVGPMHVNIAESYEPSGPYGAKSVGEIGIDTPPAAIANAIYNATGVRIRTLPITGEVLWRAMTAKGNPTGVSG
jgi:putative selenate reductase molybdopterin-binding subunit